MDILVFPIPSVRALKELNAKVKGIPAETIHKYFVATSSTLGSRLRYGKSRGALSDNVMLIRLMIPEM